MKDELNLVDWHGGRGVTVYRRYFFHADGPRLLITMRNAPGLCGIRECPARLVTELGQQVMKISACDQTEFHEISADRLSFIACAEIGERSGRANWPGGTPAFRTGKQSMVLVSSRPI